MFFSPILLLFLFSNVSGNKWFIDVGDNRYTSKEMRTCLFGKMNKTHYDLQHVVVPDLILDDNSSDEARKKHGCGIDATKCLSQGKIDFGIYQNNAGATWMRMKTMPAPNVGLSNDAFVTNELSFEMTALPNPANGRPPPKANGDCVSEMIADYKDNLLTRVNNDFKCPTNGGVDKSITGKEKCELTVTITKACKITIEQKVATTQEIFFKQVSENEAKMNLYCTGNYCPLTLLGASASYEHFHGNGSTPACLSEMQEEIKRKKPTWDTKICETIKNNKNLKIMKDTMWEELLVIYGCNPRLSTTFLPSTATPEAKRQDVNVPSSNRIDASSGTLTGIQGTPITISDEVLNMTVDSNRIAESNATLNENRSLATRNPVNGTAMNAAVDSKKSVWLKESPKKQLRVYTACASNDSAVMKIDTFQIHAVEAPESSVTDSTNAKQTTNTFAYPGIILMIFTWLGIILTSCLFVLVLWKFDSETEE